MKMGRRPRCSSVTYRFRYAPSSRPAAAGQLPDRRPVLIATKARLFMGQDTNLKAGLRTLSAVALALEPG